MKALLIALCAAAVAGCSGFNLGGIAYCSANHNCTYSQGKPAERVVMPAPPVPSAVMFQLPPQPAQPSPPR